MSRRASTERPCRSTPRPSVTQRPEGNRASAETTRARRKSHLESPILGRPTLSQDRRSSRISVAPGLWQLSLESLVLVKNACRFQRFVRPPDMVPQTGCGRTVEKWRRLGVVHWRGRGDLQAAGTSQIFAILTDGRVEGYLRTLTPSQGSSFRKKLRRRRRYAPRGRYRYLGSRVKCASSHIRCGSAAFAFC